MIRVIIAYHGKPSYLYKTKEDVIEKWIETATEQGRPVP